MTDELRNERSGQREDRSAPRVRRPYVRPELVEFGSVTELTRGNSGPKGDTKGKKRL